MNTRAQSLVLILFGGALIRLAAGDALLQYVRPNARPWVLAAGGALVGLAVWSLATERAGSHSGSHSAGRDAHDHGATTRVAWLMLTPVIAVVGLAPPPLGAFTALRAPVRPTAPTDTVLPPLAAGDPVRLSLVEFATRAIGDAGRTLAGRTVVLTAFVTGDSSGGFTMARLVITCCAADARPIYVRVLTRSPTLPANTWITVAGRYAGQSPADRWTPMMTARSVQQVPTPSDPFDK